MGPHAPGNKNAQTTGLEMTQPASFSIHYSFVIPIFNEEDVLPLLLPRILHLTAGLDGAAEVIFVDDGSSDGSAAVLAAITQHNPVCRSISLSRNFGHQIAITAGMDVARGEAIIVMDADLQDPPEIVTQMIARWKAGFQVVYAKRLTRSGESWFKRTSAHMFYKLLKNLTQVDIPRDVGDFRLIDRKVLDAFKAMPERDRFVRGMFAWLGFRQTAIEFHRPERAAGETKYPLFKMMRLALNGIIGFSDTPLRLAIWLGMGISALALVYGVYVIAMWVSHSQLVSGWSSTIVIISFLCGINMLMTGIIGLYIGRIYNEVKRRPLYVVNQRAGFTPVEISAQDNARAEAAA